MAFCLLLVWALLHSVMAADSPVPTHCGRGRYFQRRIVGGQASRSGEWPWLVSVMVPVGGEIKQAHICGGTLISPQWVITAAHCFYARDKPGSTPFPNPGDYVIRIGEHDLFDNDADHMDVIPSKIILHEMYNSWFLLNDLALVKLPSAVTLNDRVNLACLPGPNEVLPPKCIVAGWGYTDIYKTRTPVVRHVEVDIFNTRSCIGTDDPAHICAGHTGQGYKGTCSGDSGGPFVCYDEDERAWILAGVVSSGTSQDICDSRANPGLFARVSHYLGWIESTIADN